MTQAIHNPIRWSDIRPGMTPAERFFACCLSRGVPCQLGDAVPQESTPRNTISADVIRFFAFGGDAEHIVRGAFISLTGAWICREKLLDLTHANIPYALGFYSCHFDLAVEMRHAVCEALYMVGSHLTQGLACDGMNTKGSVYLRGGFVANDEVRLLGANIGGTLDCGGGNFINPEGGIALNADNITTGSGVRLTTIGCWKDSRFAPRVKCGWWEQASVGL